MESFRKHLLRSCAHSPRALHNTYLISSVFHPDGQQVMFFTFSTLLLVCPARFFAAVSAARRLSEHMFLRRMASWHPRRRLANALATGSREGQAWAHMAARFAYLRSKPMMHSFPCTQNNQNFIEHRQLTRSNQQDFKQPITINIKHAKDKRKKHR